MAYNDPNEPWPGFNGPRDGADAVMQDRIRVAAILDSAEGKRNPTMAREMALQRGMGVDEAVSLLAMIPGAENPLASTDNPYRAALDAQADIKIRAPAGNVSLDPRAQRIAELQAAGRSLNARHTHGKGERV